MNSIDSWFSRMNIKILLLCSCLLVVLFGFMDYFSGFELAFSLFYLIPIALIAWYGSRNQALIISILSTLSWYFSNILAGENFSNGLIGAWNSVVRLMFFAIVSILLSHLKRSIEQEKILSRTDFITGITNSRAFYDQANFELLRAKRTRSCFSVAYIDLDDFKQINDRFGHRVGDDVLRTVAGTLRSSLRRTDIVARMGGDEFIIFLPDADADAGQVVIKKIQSLLCETMEKNSWGVTFSIGVVTYYDHPAQLDEVIHRADEVMYMVKKQGKNNFHLEVVGQGF